MKGQVPLPKVSSVHGSLPRARKMSTSLVVKVQFTSTPSVPAVVVVNTTHPRNPDSSESLPCETILVTAAGAVVGGGVQVAPAGLLLQVSFVPQLGSTSAARAMVRRAKTAKPPPYCFRALISLSPMKGISLRAHRAAAVPDDADARARSEVAATYGVRLSEQGAATRRRARSGAQ